MKLAVAAYLFILNTVWCVIGLRCAGRALIHALSSKDENLRVIAGMFLVRSGRKAEPLLQEAMQKGENLPMVLTLLGDLGDPECELALRKYCNDNNPEVARAAQDALKVLAARR